MVFWKEVPCVYIFDRLLDRLSLSLFTSLSRASSTCNVPVESCRTPHLHGQYLRRHLVLFAVATPPEGNRRHSRTRLLLLLSYPNQKSKEEGLKKKKKTCWAPASRRSPLALPALPASPCTSSRRRSGARIRFWRIRCA